MEFNWVKIDNGDWECKLSNGDLLRVERMNRHWVWWCFYLDGVSYDCWNYNLPTTTTINEAKLNVQNEYQNKLKLP